MAKRSKSDFLNLPGSTMIEVIGIKSGQKPFKKEMTIDEANKIPKKRGWTYHRFQLGYSQFIDVVVK